MLQNKVVLTRRLVYCYLDPSCENGRLVLVAVKLVVNIVEGN
jgi:hypothetical protein